MSISSDFLFSITMQMLTSGSLSKLYHVQPKLENFMLVLVLTIGFSFLVAWSFDGIFDLMPRP